MSRGLNDKKKAAMWRPERRAFQLEDTAHAKALGQAWTWSVGGTVGDPCDWNRASEGKRGRGRG